MVANAQQSEANENAISRRVIHPIRDYLRDTWAEMKKVTWPTREEAINLTLIVLVVMVSMSLFLGGLDVIFSSLVQAVVRAFLGIA